MGGMFKKPKKSKTAKYIERPGVALEQDLPSYTRSAQQATAARLAEIERVLPGATREREMALSNLAQDRQRLDEMGAITGAMMRGELPKDVQEQTMRSIAEFGGAGFNPATAGRAGGFQVAQGMVPRQFGLQSLQLQQQGLGYEQQRIQQKQQLQNTSMGWQQLADAFAYDPLEVSQFSGPSQAYGQQKASAKAYDAKVNAANQASATNQIIGTIGTVGAIAAAPFTGGATLAMLPTTMGMMGGGAAGGGDMGGAIAGGIGQFGSGGGMGFTNPFGPKPVTGYGGQTYVPSQGGDFYKPLTGSIFGR